MAKPVKEEEETQESLILDPRSEKSYAVSVVASIASNCDGCSPHSKILKALDLLLTAEQFSLMSEQEILLASARRGSGVSYPHLESPEEIQEMTQRAIMNSATEDIEVSRILAVCERDKNGRIKRTSFINQFCQASHTTGDPNYAGQLFRNFIDQSVELRSKDNPDVDRETILSWFEFGKKTKVFKGDDSAKRLGKHFLSWLRSQPRKQKSNASKRYRSTKTKALVDMKNKGSGRRDDGKFKTKVSNTETYSVGAILLEPDI